MTVSTQHAYVYAGSSIASTHNSKGRGGGERERKRGRERKREREKERERERERERTDHKLLNMFISTCRGSFNIAKIVSLKEKHTHIT